MKPVPPTLKYARPNGWWVTTRANTFNVLDNGTLMLTLRTETDRVDNDGDPIVQVEHVVTVAASAWIEVCSTVEDLKSR